MSRRRRRRDGREGILSGNSLSFTNKRVSKNALFTFWLGIGCLLGLVILVLIYHTITQKTTFGRHIYAVGGNKNAAALSGVNVEKTYFLTMLNMSVLAALAGILFVGRSTAAGPSDGTGWETDAIASVFIGGAAVSGGVGTIMATMIGGRVMAVLNSGLMLLGVGADKTQVIKGLVLLAAVAIDVYNKRPGHVSITKRLFNLNSAEKKEGSSAEKK